MFSRGRHYIADTIFMLRFEAGGQVRKALSVVKKRTGKHENRLREFGVVKNKLHVGEPLTHFRGVLTGVPEFVGGSPRRRAAHDGHPARPSSR
jgi:circadian clock protein KaiC